MDLIGIKSKKSDLNSKKRGVFNEALLFIFKEASEMEYPYKHVEFMFCKTCKYWKTPPDEEPCNECLDEPVNLNSYRPVNYEEKET